MLSEPSLGRFFSEFKLVALSEKWPSYADIHFLSRKSTIHENREELSDVFCAELSVSVKIHSPSVF